MHVIKRRGHKEKYDEKKVYASVYAACQTCEMHEKQCEKMAGAVTKQITSLIRKHKILDSEDISKNVIKMLKKKDKDAAFMYETHLDVS